MAVAIFDLDHTLIDTDSDHSWGEFLVAKGVVDAVAFKKANDYFYEQYKNSSLDIDEYLKFALRPLADNPPEKMHALREEFVKEIIRPLIKPNVAALLDKHRQAGDILMIISATNRFIVDPIAEEIGIPEVLAIEVEMEDGRYTGRHYDIPTYQAGKVTRFMRWMEQNPGHKLEECWFYSDSKNDLPLLKKVGKPVAVDADDILKTIAQENGWPVISLKVSIR
ncbi:HAD-IB family hydrolase [Sansalvadorimonas sp. 2012CJ34-2]|uniref:HAD-IB family hydrolase n=1 Tax=Parendozoicomonas callyspongiae TaxID=2942213 RepID=A0ABT0PGJ9_9GAMM|nr:HAD-IB family hydrolase [Sansalvadorimonas sp. 2012CJ34-2]